MAERKPFLLRLPADLLDDLNLWARDELRSLNAQIEYALRESIKKRRRVEEPREKSAPAKADEQKPSVGE